MEQEQQATDPLFEPAYRLTQAVIELRDAQDDLRAALQRMCEAEDRVDRAIAAVRTAREDLYKAVQS